MNQLERFRAVMNFQPFDRLPRIEWAGWWDKTVERWQGEGLGISDRYEIYRHFGLDVYYQHWFNPRTGPLPQYGHGLGCVASMDDYLRILPSLYGQFDEGVESLRAYGRAQDAGDALAWITLEGFFWFPREILGIERHLFAFYDQPELMHRINADLADWHVRILRAVADVCRPAFMTFAEDMSYNNGPMLSRGLFDEFLAPYYRRVIPVLQEMETTVFVDTDGDMTSMIPWLQSVGIAGVLPLERQAGVDGLDIRRQHGRWLMIGHFDKMTMPRGEQAMRQEFERLLPLMRTGGYIPSVDHQTPPGVSLANYRAYLNLLKEYTVLAATRP